MSQNIRTFENTAELRTNTSTTNSKHVNIQKKKSQNFKMEKHARNTENAGNAENA